MPKQFAGFLRDNRFASASFAVLLLARIGFELWAQGISAPPLDAPIALSSAGSVDRRIRIRVPDSYGLELSFRAGSLGMDRLRDLIGNGSYDSHGERIPSGVRVPIRWSLSEIDGGRTVAQGESESFGSSSWSSDEISRDVARIAVAPGQYRFQARITGDVAELTGVPARLSMRLHPKAAGSWRTSLVWGGRMATLLLIDPGLALLAAFLLWRAVGAGRSRRRMAPEPRA